MVSAVGAAVVVDVVVDVTVVVVLVLVVVVAFNIRCLQRRSAFGEVAFLT